MRKPTEISQQGEQLIQSFIDVLATSNGLSPKTLKEYASDLKHFIRWFEAAAPPGDPAPFRIEHVDTPALIRYREAMQRSMKLKPATINRRLVTLKRFFEWAGAEAGVKRDPSKPVKLVPEEKAPPKPMTDQEEAALLAAIGQKGSLRDQTLVSVMLHTGLRTMEICDLTPGDVGLNESGSYITVRSGIRNKTRDVPLNAACRAALEPYLAKLPPDASYLFPSEKTGARLTERALRHLIRKYMKAAGIKGLRAHDLRHRFGYVMAASLALPRLAQIMGHHNPNTTMVYVKPNRAEPQAEVNI